MSSPLDGHHRRASTRLRIERGHAVLLCDGLPDATCALEDLSDGGCRCVVLLGMLGKEQAANWRARLVADCELTLQLHLGSCLERFEVRADVRHVQVGAGGAMQIGLRFLNLNEAQIQSLGQAILSFATEKIRGAFGDKEQAANAYLVGGGPEGRLVPEEKVGKPIVEKEQQDEEKEVDHVDKQIPGGKKKRRIFETMPPSRAGACRMEETVVPIGTSRPAAPPVSQAAEFEDASDFFEVGMGDVAPPGFSKVPVVPAEIDEPAEAEDLMHAQKGDDPEAKDRSVAPADEPENVDDEVDANKESVGEVDKGSETKDDLVAIASDMKEVAPLEPAPPPPAPLSPASKGTSKPTFRGLRLGKVLVGMGKLSEFEVQRAVAKAGIAGERMGRYLLRKGLVSPSELCRALGLQSGLPMTDLTDLEIPRSLAEIFPFPLMLEHEFLPFDDSYFMVCVAAANPLSKKMVVELERLSQRKVEIFLADEDIILGHLDALRPDDKKVPRRHLRYKVRVPLSYQFCNRLRKPLDPNIYQGETIDISEGGFMLSGQPAQAGDPDELRRRGACLDITLRCDGEDVAVLCGIAFIKVDDSKTFPWQIGLKILDIKNSGRQALKKICIDAGKAQGS